MATNPPLLRGIKQISHALNVSPSTLRRMVKKGLVPVHKGGTGGRTSPLILTTDALRKPEKD